MAIAVSMGLAAAAIAGEPRHGEDAVTCTNQASGASWQIMIDYDRNTVDANPARISEAEISWRDAKDGWRYTLDRTNGKLTVVFASSVGGNMYFHRCKLEN